MERQYVTSSDLHWVEYDEQLEELTIGFNSGGVYRYSGVPAGVCEGLLCAGSKGSYFHAYIKNRYPAGHVR